MEPIVGATATDRRAGKVALVIGRATGPWPFGGRHVGQSCGWAAVNWDKQLVERVVLVELKSNDLHGEAFAGQRCARRWLIDTGSSRPWFCPPTWQPPGGWWHPWCCLVSGGST